MGFLNLVSLANEKQRIYTSLKQNSKNKNLKLSFKEISKRV